MLSIVILGSWGGEGGGGRSGAPATRARWTGGCVDAKIEELGFGFARVGFYTEIFRRSIQEISLAENGRQRLVCWEKFPASKEILGRELDDGLQRLLSDHLTLELTTHWRLHDE